MNKHFFIRIGSLARLVFIDGLRRYALIGLIIFALTAEASGLLFFDFIPRDIGRASNDFLFSITWVSGIIFLLFHAVNTAAWDDGRRVIHTFLARPISRTEYLLGVFTGLAALLLALNVILGGIGWVILHNIKSRIDPAYFPYLDITYYLLSGLGIYYLELILLSVILFFSGAIRGSFPVLLLTISYYFICNGLPVVREVVSAEIEAGNESMQGLATLLKWMTAVFPDFSRLDFKALVTVSEQTLSSGYIFTIFGISTLYIIIVLWLASLIYQHRDLI